MLVDRERVMSMYVFQVCTFLTAISNPVDVIKTLMYVCNKYSMLNDLKLKLHVLVCSPNIAKGLIEFHCSCR